VLAYGEALSIETGTLFANSFSPLEEAAKGGLHAHTYSQLNANTLKNWRF
jgi:hypothetical protein